MNKKFDKTKKIVWLETLRVLAEGKLPNVNQISDAMEYILDATTVDPTNPQWAADQEDSDTIFPAQIAGFIMALTVNAITPEILESLAIALIHHATDLPQFPIGIDIVGTGGDKIDTANISTLAAITTAAAGIRVIKHGSRSASSRMGSADLLESLGINLQPSIDTLRICATDLGICFLFAPYFHHGLQKIAPIRRQLGVRTVFNLLGPLINPIGDIGGLIGLADNRAIDAYCDIFSHRRGLSLIVRGLDGQDEISTTGLTQSHCVGTINNEVINIPLTIDPRDFDIPIVSIEQISSGEDNISIALSVLEGTRSVFRDAVIINAGAAIALGALSESTRISSAMGSTCAVTDIEQFLHDPKEAIAQGIRCAVQAIDSGEALRLLERWKRVAGA